jgi:hypothetical protein
MCAICTPTIVSFILLNTPCILEGAITHERERYNYNQSLEQIDDFHLFLLYKKIYF